MSRLNSARRPNTMIYRRKCLEYKQNASALHLTFISNPTAGVTFIRVGSGMQAKLRNEKSREKDQIGHLSFSWQGSYRLPPDEPWLCQPAMTAVADATDSSTVEQLVQVVEDLQKTVERQADRINKFEDELADHMDHTGREFADVRARITDVENQQTQPDSTDSTPKGLTGRKPGRRTNRHRLSGSARSRNTLPSANSRPIKSARFIAKDVHDYAEKAPTGLILDSQTIKKVITAAEDKKPRTQTVARIIDFFEDLGQDDIEVTKRRGKKLIVINPEVADRLAYHDRYDGGT